MDEHVLAAMARWPDVPDVYGWLSLTRQGQWRLHPDGRGNRPLAADPARYPPGDPISNEQILGFMHRNYIHDEQGRWFFQNGPQRVFVRLDAAPLTLRTAGAGDALELVSHNALPVSRIASWTLDDEGRLFAATEHGPGLIDGRDLQAVMDLLSFDGQPLSDALSAVPAPGADASPALPPRLAFGALPGHPPAAFGYCAAADIPAKLGFVANPAADDDRQAQARRGG